MIRFEPWVDSSQSTLRLSLLSTIIRYSRIFARIIDLKTQGPPNTGDSEVPRSSTNRIRYPEVSTELLKATGHYEDTAHYHKSRHTMHSSSSSSNSSSSSSNKGETVPIAVSDCIGSTALACSSCDQIGRGERRQESSGQESHSRDHTLPKHAVLLVECTPFRQFPLEDYLLATSLFVCARVHEPDASTLARPDDRETMRSALR
ncbi:uncharacterized protein LOC117226753 isoform X1 [Megalopta genalis]|uniref:uncharacterized protein LOC117226753 isoform X1 n=1 Tax=Megalopta genalis TaxID=115081 RepID=UPI003FD24FD9